jgi:hypothetical protein
VALVEVALPAAGRPSPAVDAFLGRAHEAHEAWFEATRDDVVPAFVASDGAAVWRALSAIATARLAPGPVFCEWGSGLGVATALAAHEGFEAYGIEVVPALVLAARRLAQDFAPQAVYARGSFLPAGTEVDEDLGQEMAWLDTGAAPAYEELGLDVDEIDLVFAYPWPGEEHAVTDCFDQHAGTGALLLTWHGVEGMRLVRKAPRARRRRR